MSYTLIITEKPNASKQIAEAFGSKRPKKDGADGVPYYEISYAGKSIVVACAVGHLYGLAEKIKSKNFAYPVFETAWKPAYELNKFGAHTKKYINTLKRLAKDADSFIVATDYDIEGEVIGLNCLRFACNQKDGQRMKFSTLTKPDIIEAFNKKNKHIDWGQAEAGLTRHQLDWIYGINLSRALTSAIKKAGTFKIMSSGRVQGPALKIIVEREKEIKAFKPEPFWQIELKASKPEMTAWHEKDKFWNQKEVEAAYKKIHNEKKGVIEKIERREAEKQPPYPFDLTTLQIEAYGCFKISPKRTLEIAQNLYTGGFISYPRTSSQQLPPSLNFKQIINSLMKQDRYTSLGKEVLKTRLMPNNGKKTDSAHPAIYPTGIGPSKLGGQELKIYDIIVKRFFATFGAPAKRETITATISVKEEKFIAKGTRTIETGWFALYSPYVHLEEIELPLMKEKDIISIKKLDLHQRETQPPKRYTEASILKELEKRNLGTKATRAHILDTLVQRNYIAGTPLEATELGMHLVDVLGKYCPKIQDEELTREFEEDMERIREGKKKQENIISRAKSVLTSILEIFKTHEQKIGEGLIETIKKTAKKLSFIAKCPICKEGNLVLRTGRFGRFIACDKYPKCKTTFSIPAQAFVKPTEKLCEHCGYPIIGLLKKGRFQTVCINQNCPSKKIKTTKQGKKCPDCKEGKLVIKKSIYGSFLACDNYPKCRHIEKIER